MNPREKILVICVAIALGSVVLYGAANRLVLKPGRDLAGQIASLEAKKNKLETEKRRLDQYRELFAGLRDRTVDDDATATRLLLEKRLDRLARAAGLGEGDYAITNFTKQRLGDAGWELVYKIDATRKPVGLDRMTNFLYLLRQDKHLHRIIDLSITADRRDRRQVQFWLKYSTLVLDSRLPVEKIPARQVRSGSLWTEADLSGSKRAEYEVIARRHVFLPYVQLVRRVDPPPTPPPASPPQPQPEAPTPQRSWYDDLQVVGLPAHNGIPEIHLAPPGQDMKTVRKVGDRLPIGLIVMVDYRPMPMPIPGDPKNESQSRLILRVGKNYWAVESGQALHQRRVLRPDELPDELKPKPSTTQPAEKASVANSGNR